MPEWLRERGIGETRFALIEDGEIIEARIDLDGVVAAGTVLSARLVNNGTNGRNAVAVVEGGGEYLLPRGAPGMTQGQTVAIKVTRARIPGAEPWKRALAMISDGRAETLPVFAARDVAVPSIEGWDDVIDEARSGVATFAGGELRISVTPAMTLIDVDGFLSVDDLAVVGAREAARAIRRLDIGGSTGIDLPTAGSKAARQAAAAAIDAVLPQPFERTAVNGFGFVQVVRPRHRASLVELAQDRALFEARALLRRAAYEGPGARSLVAHPAVAGAIERNAEWIEALSRQLGGAIGLRSDPALTMSGGYVEQA